MPGTHRSLFPPIFLTPGTDMIHSLKLMFNKLHLYCCCFFYIFKLLPWCLFILLPASLQKKCHSLLRTWACKSYFKAYICFSSSGNLRGIYLLLYSFIFHASSCFNTLTAATAGFVVSQAKVYVYSIQFSFLSLCFFLTYAYVFLFFYSTLSARSSSS